ncbi:MAG TPA: glycosyltransferase family 4 protein [Candidatus Angelobacter sp.]|nr:glycosyltransferase family 4 protein [Candidatus Angelobacter sp.]
MRLLFVHERFGALGGAESNACMTAAELARRGFTVGLLHGPGTGKDEQRWTEVFPERFPLGGQPRAAAQAALEVFRPDLVYVHKMADLSVIEALADWGGPVVRMVHDHDIYCMKSYRYSYFTRRICTRPVGAYCVFPCGAFLARNRDGLFPLKYVSYRAKKREVQLNQQFQRVVVVSEYMKQELLRNGFEAERIEIHPPVPRMGDSGIRSTFSPRNLILFAGQIIRGKGVDVLLRSLARLRCPFECVILGDGSHRPTCERLSRKLGLSERVVFKGFVPQQELKGFYGECSVVAVSSVWPEPIATIGLEAMRYALPVVAFDAGGIKDWLIDGENGFLVPWMDQAQFAARLEQLLLDKQLARQMGQRGLAISEQRFGFDRYLLDLEQMFQTVLREHKRRPQAQLLVAPVT